MTGESTAARDGRPSRKVVILTALDVEMTSVLRRMTDTTSQKLVGGTRYEVGSFLGDHIDWIVAAAEIGEGNLGAAVEATAAIRDIRPSLIMFVGVAGGLRTDMQHGSVVVATKVYSYHGGRAGEEFQARPLAISTDHSLSQIARDVKRTVWMADPRPEVSLKAIAAGDQVIASRLSPEFRLLLERYNDAVAVDMESAGMYVAAERADHLPAIAIRAISDLIDDKAPDSDANWQPIAAENAAAFAFAMLRAIRVGDLATRSDSVPGLATDRDVATLPPTVAAILSRALVAGVPRAQWLLEALKGTTSPVATASDLVAPDSGLGDSGSPDLWTAVAEYAIAHRNHAAGARAFVHAADVDLQRASRWHARAALAFSAAGSSTEAEVEVSAARIAGGDKTFVDVVEASLAEDNDRIVAIAADHWHEDPLVDLLAAQAIALTAGYDAALDFARSALTLVSTIPNTGGLALVIARLLLARDEAHDATSLSANTDLHDAVNLALLVRDSRRVWGGPSAEAAYIAAAAALKGGDPHVAFKIAVAAPVGEASASEATDPSLSWLGANAATALGRFEDARRLAVQLESEALRILIEVECDLAEGVTSAGARERLFAALPELDTPSRFRAYLQLVELGETDLPDLASLNDNELAEIVASHAELKAGKRNEAIRRLRRLQTPRGRAFLVGAYVEADRIADAVTVLRENASRFGQPGQLIHAARLLGRIGRYSESRDAANEALSLAAAGSQVARDARAILIESSSRLRDWNALAQYAASAIAQGQDSPDFRWAELWAHFNRRDLSTALRLYSAEPVRPRDDDDAILLTQLLRTSLDVERAVRQLLDVADQYRGSERVSAAAFMALIEVARDAELPTELRARQQELSSAFFEAWPDSKIVYRIDASDIQNVVDHLRDTLKPAAGFIEDLAQKAQLGEMPYGLLAAAVGRSVAEALVKNAAGCIAAGETERQVADAADAVALGASDLIVVADTSAFLGSLRTGLDASLLTSNFSSVVAATVTLDDAFVAADALRLKSTSSMGWNAREDRPQLTEVSAEVAEEWAVESERLLGLIRLAALREPQGDRSDKLGLEAVVSPIRLAKELAAPLWSDERAVRVLAQSEGVASFGTVSLLRALEASGVITVDDVENAEVQMLRAGMVDFRLRQSRLLDVAETEGWTGQRAGLYLSRSNSWADPEEALATYRQGLIGAMSTDLPALQQWTFAAAVGSSRRAANPCAMAAVVILSGFAALDMDPRQLPALVEGGRIAAVLLDCPDPLMTTSRLLASTLRDHFPESQTATAFTRLVSQLTVEDRGKALNEFLRA